MTIRFSLTGFPKVLGKKKDFYFFFSSALWLYMESSALGKQVPFITYNVYYSSYGGSCSGKEQHPVAFPRAG